MTIQIAEEERNERQKLLTSAGRREVMPNLIEIELTNCGGKSQRKISSGNKLVRALRRVLRRGSGRGCRHRAL